LIRVEENSFGKGGGELKEEISSCDMAKSVQMKKERWLRDKKKPMENEHRTIV
jgi:hypothetical protein